MTAEALEYMYKLLVNIIFGGAGVWAIKIVGTELIKRYFEIVKQRSARFEHFASQLNEALTKIQNILDKFDHHKEMDEEFRTHFEDRLLQTNLRNKEELTRMVEKIAEINIIQKERYAELSGKLKKQWSDISLIKERVTKIEVDCKHNHTKK